MTVHPQSRESFLAGLRLYEQRNDKGYSLVDCISMTTMRRHAILEVLTNDRHFMQEGFRGRPPLSDFADRAISPHLSRQRIPVENKSLNSAASSVTGPTRRWGEVSGSLRVDRPALGEWAAVPPRAREIPIWEISSLKPR